MRDESYDQADADFPEIADIIRLLNRAGWSIGSAAFDGPGGRTWVVTGRNGENLVRAEGDTELLAWRRAQGQAREVGMHRRYDPGGGGHT